MVSWLRPADGGCELHLHIQPGAAKSGIAGLHGDALKVRVQAPPVEGAANAALLAFIAKSLGLAPREVRLLRGEKSRQKTLWVALAPDEVQARLELPDA
jgi:hypothetical protein